MKNQTLEVKIIDGEVAIVADENEDGGHRSKRHKAILQGTPEEMMILAQMIAKKCFEAVGHEIQLP